MDLNKHFGYDSGEPWELDPDRYDFSVVDWANPLPTDAVALFALENRSARRFAKLIQHAMENGLSPDDLPLPSDEFWNNVIIPSGLAHQFEDMDKEGIVAIAWEYRNTGEAIAEDRFINSMGDNEELVIGYLEFRAERRAMFQQAVADIMANVDLDEVSRQITEATQKREAEIDLLNEMWEA
jgi:hypothetical protein